MYARNILGNKMVSTITIDYKSAGYCVASVVHYYFNLNMCCTIVACDLSVIFLIFAWPIISSKSSKEFRVANLSSSNVTASAVSTIPLFVYLYFTWRFFLVASSFLYRVFVISIVFHTVLFIDLCSSTDFICCYYL